MNDNSWLDYVIAIGTIATPLMALALGAIIWKYRQTIERQIRLEEHLRDDRIEIYNQILEPFIIILMTDVAWASDPRTKNKDKSKVGTDKILSLEYRKASFRLSLIGSDSVVLAYNDLMQYFFTRSDSSPTNTLELMRYFGSFLLEIRKSMGNESTKIDHFAILESFLKDIRTLREQSSVN